MYKVIRLILTYFICFFFLPMTMAATQNTGFGGVAQNLMEPVTLFSDLLQTICFLLGGSFIFASIIKYVEHRRSPLMVPISTVIFLVIAGILLLLLPLLAYVTNHGMAYSLFKAK